MLGLDLFLTVAMGYVTYINYKAGKKDWMILSAICTVINAYSLLRHFV